MSKEQKRLENIMAALKEYGIHNEAELDAALVKMTPLDISCMASPINGVCTDNQERAEAKC